MNFKNNNDKNMYQNVELTNNKGDLKMNQEKIYNNKQTLRPVINNKGQLNVIKTEVNKDELTYNEVTLNSGTINQLKNGVYKGSFCYGKKLIPTLENINELDEVTLYENDILKIPQLNWAYYPNKKLNKNNPYIAFLYKLFDKEVILIQQLHEDSIRLKVVTNDIDLILMLEDIKNSEIKDNKQLLKAYTMQAIKKHKGDRLNDYNLETYNYVDYNKPLYEEQDKNGEAITDYKSYNLYEYEVKDSTKNIERNKQQIQKRKNLLNQIERINNQIKNTKSKMSNIGEYAEFLTNKTLYDTINNMEGKELFNRMNHILNKFSGLLIVEDDVWNIYRHQKISKLENRKNELNEEINKIGLD